MADHYVNLMHSVFAVNCVAAPNAIIAKEARLYDNFHKKSLEQMAEPVQEMSGQGRRRGRRFIAGNDIRHDVSPVIEVWANSNRPDSDSMSYFNEPLNIEARPTEPVRFAALAFLLMGPDTFEKIIPALENTYHLSNECIRALDLQRRVIQDRVDRPVRKRRTTRPSQVRNLEAKVQKPSGTKKQIHKQRADKLLYSPRRARLCEMRGGTFVVRCCARLQNFPDIVL